MYNKAVVFHRHAGPLKDSVGEIIFLTRITVLDIYAEN